MVNYSFLVKEGFNNNNNNGESSPYKEINDYLTGSNNQTLDNLINLIKDLKEISPSKENYNIVTYAFVVITNQEQKTELSTTNLLNYIDALSKNTQFNNYFYEKDGEKKQQYCAIEYSLGLLKQNQPSEKTTNYYKIFEIILNKLESMNKINENHYGDKDNLTQLLTYVFNKFYFSDNKIDINWDNIMTLIIDKSNKDTNMEEILLQMTEFAGDNKILPDNNVIFKNLCSKILIYKPESKNRELFEYILNNLPEAKLTENGFKLIKQLHNNLSEEKCNYKESALKREEQKINLIYIIGGVVIFILIVIILILLLKKKKKKPNKFNKFN